MVFNLSPSVGLAAGRQFICQAPAPLIFVDLVIKQQVGPFVNLIFLVYSVGPSNRVQIKQRASCQYECRCRQVQRQEQRPAGQASKRSHGIARSYCRPIQSLSLSSLSAIRQGLRLIVSTARLLLVSPS